MHTELSNLRTLCARVLIKEHQETEKWKAHCVTFKQERDAARERVRALMAADSDSGSDSGEGKGRGVKRVREEGEEELDVRVEDEDDGVRGYMRSCASPSTVSTSSSSPCSPIDGPLAALTENEAGVDKRPYTVGVMHLPKPTRFVHVVPEGAKLKPKPNSRGGSASLSPRPRPRPLSVASTGRGDSGRRRGGSPASKGDSRTCFDVTVVSGRHVPGEQGAKRRRASGCSEGSGLSGCTAVGDDDDEGDGVEPGEVVEGEEEVVVCGRGCEDVLACEKEQEGVKSRVGTPQIEVAHVDLMYVPMNGKLVCRVCL